MKNNYFLIVSITLSLFISNCSGSTSPLPATPVPAQDAAMPRTLTICLGYEPESLYPYGTSSQAAWAVLEAIYDGPIDTVNYQPTPVILDSLPSLSNGNLTFEPVEVKAGDEVINADGYLVSLAAGVTLFPSGCTSPECLLTWDGTSPLQMDRMNATFSLKTGLTWSDGQPLSAADSVYSFQLAADPATPVEKSAVDQTAEYTALDERRVRWVSKPGLVSAEVQRYFWMPLPQHVWGKYNAGELLTAEESSRKPLGWGAYVLEEWRAGEYIRLTRNPNYFRIKERLPRFNALIFKFISIQGDANISAVVKNHCDFVNQTTLMSDQTEMLDYLLNYYRDPQIRVLFGNGAKIEYLIFQNSTQKGSAPDQKNPIANLQMRQAIAACIDRDMLNKQFFDTLAKLPATYLPPEHPLLIDSITDFSYQPEHAATLLSDAGWIDHDQNSKTPREQNQEDASIEYLQLNLITDLSEPRRSIAEFIAQSLQECGIQVEVIAFTQSDFYKPDGPFWNGDFDLALSAWVSGKIPPCFLASQIPQNYVPDAYDQNLFNVGNYHNSQVDEFCQKSFKPFLTANEQSQIQEFLQNTFREELPFFPLFAYLEMDIARKDLCPYEFDVSARSDLRDIELMDFGTHCTAAE